MAAVVAVLAGLYVSVATLTMCRSRKPRDVAGACHVIVLPAITVAALVCGLLYRAISP
ncbi:MAG: hypothetical protein ACJ8AI_06365 [Rhodopila sp.]